MAKWRKPLSKETYLALQERDKGICQKCGGRATETHHIIFLSRYRGQRWKYNFDGPHDLRNLASVCKKCHDWAHGRYHDGLRKRGEGTEWFIQWTIRKFGDIYSDEWNERQKGIK